MRSVIDILDLTTEELEGLMATALDIVARPDDYAEVCRRKKLATLFFEPSTRTRMSFEAAMYELGGNVISMSSAASSSAAKGESVADTAKVVSCYADIIAIRHPKEGAALVAAENADVPVINAGDGGHCHPTQTLADLLTIRREKGAFEGLTVGLCGDLKFGRTVHSLINALSRYRDVRFVLISPEELKVPSYVKRDVLKKQGIPYQQTTSLEEAIPELDILYKDCYEILTYDYGLKIWRHRVGNAGTQELGGFTMSIGWPDDEIKKWMTTRIPMDNYPKD